MPPIDEDGALCVKFLHYLERTCVGAGHGLKLYVNQLHMAKPATRCGTDTCGADVPCIS